MTRLVEGVWRYRITFSKGDEVQFISHLDVVRAWERALRRADVGLAYSHGFSPHARLFFASALPVGVTGRAELLDVLLDRRLELRELAMRLTAQLPPGLALSSVAEVPMEWPSLPAQVRAAEYEVCVESASSGKELAMRVQTLLAATSLPRATERDGKQRTYDLRPLIQKLELAGKRSRLFVVRMRLQTDGQGTGRPDEVMAALGCAEGVHSMERVELFLQDAAHTDPMRHAPHSPHAT